MNKTERPLTDQIISSGVTVGTERNDGTIISSSTDSPLIISSSLSKDVVLNGTKYNIVKLIARSGESEIYLVNQNGSNFVFKYYYSQYKPKDEILSKLKGLKHPDIICLLDHGFYQDRFFEISEYAQGGTLQEIIPVNSILKVKEIVGETIEALNYCHSHGIIHRDIKPENIFYRTIDKKDIVIGDFGIASNVKEGEEDVLTTQARTNLYAAPELFSGIRGKTLIEKSVDYYALGITLLHLWFGRNPFEDIDEYSVMRLKSEGRIVFPDDIDHEVEKLIKGLITVNPRDRWAYDEVKRWLGGENVKVNYQTVQFEYKPYAFGMIDGQQIVVNSPKEIAQYLEKYPEKGEGHLYRNTIAKWIEPIDLGLFNELMDIVEKDFPRDKPAGIAKAIYILDTESPFKGFNKDKLPTQEDIALEFEQNFKHYRKDLQNNNASFYIFLEARNYKAKADEYRNYFKITNAEAALNTIIFNLQGADKFIYCGHIIYHPLELLSLDDSTKTKLIIELANINSKLSLWISGFKDFQFTIDKWRVLKRYDVTTLSYALQQGFELYGTVVNDISGFSKLINSKFSDFFILDKDDKRRLKDLTADLIIDTIEESIDETPVGKNQKDYVAEELSRIYGESLSKKVMVLIPNDCFDNPNKESIPIEVISTKLSFVIDSNRSEADYWLKNYRSEADYWLKNYLGSSFEEVVLQYIKLGQLPVSNFYYLFEYALDNHKDVELNIYQLLENVLPYVKLCVIDNKDLILQKENLQKEKKNIVIELPSLTVVQANKINNYLDNPRGFSVDVEFDYLPQNLYIRIYKFGKKLELFELQEKTHNVCNNCIIQRIVISVGNSFANSISSDKSFIKSLEDYLSFLENNISSNADLFSQIAIKVDNIIAFSIRKVLENIKSDETQIESFLADVSSIIKRLQHYFPDLPYINRYTKEYKLISKKRDTIKKLNKAEKGKKIEILDSHYSSILEKRKLDVKENYKLDWNNDKFAYIYYILASLGAVWMLINVILRFQEGEIFKGIVDIIIGIALMAAIGWGVGWIISLIVNVYAKSDAKTKGILDAINNVFLLPVEQSAYDTSVNEIDKHFKEKESYEIFQEKVRILLLDNEQFEKEFKQLNLAN